MNDSQESETVGQEEERSVGKRVAQAPVLFYRRYISPLKPPTCRFYPTCSAYALEAIEVHGALKGSMLAMKRIAKCHPFHPGGVDKVPPKKHSE
ncbi:membrane protein insertion efficiency factor YidD [Paenibacillus sp. 1001270B_150601_E10]|uniref:membrane protein insertion efficiency factor YidD n=1 Tax=Paenibacillus sp. 1001270B_150601_E10 TaxID=2787079 RepID=UPI00189C92B1|nr:membrane protein insertion efficiency factor YidD [Paenibacillus sp. 1001270B_150601_E10]